MGYLDLHKMPVLCRYTFSTWVLPLEYFWNPWSIRVLLAVVVEHTDSSVWGTSSTVTSFIKLLQYATFCSKPIITFTYLFVFSRMNLSSNRHLLFPCQLGYLVQTVAPTACFIYDLSECTLIFPPPPVISLCFCFSLSPTPLIHGIHTYILIISRSSFRQCFA
jgi:hypothetical protein